MPFPRGLPFKVVRVDQTGGPNDALPPPGRHPRYQQSPASVPVHSTLAMEFAPDQVKDVLTVVPTLLLSVVAVLGMAILIGLSAWQLPVRLGH